MLLALLTLVACSGMDVEVPPSVNGGHDAPSPPASAPADPSHAPAAPATPDAPAEPAPPDAATTERVLKHPELVGINDPPELSLSGATELNNAGHRYYEAGNYVAAIKLWTRGTVLHPEHALLHYNLACAQALQRAEHGPCGAVEVYLRGVFVNLETAAKDPGRRARMATDTDLDSIRDTYAFQRIAAGGQLSESETRHWLSAAPLYTIGNGAFGSLHQIQLNTDGTATRSLTAGGRHARCDDPSGDCPAPPPEQGTWQLAGASVELTFGETVTSYAVSPYGSLMAEDPLGSLHVWPSECDA